MGDTGPWPLVGARCDWYTVPTALFLPIIGGVFVAENLSAILQVFSFTRGNGFYGWLLYTTIMSCVMSESKVCSLVVSILLALLAYGYRIGSTN